MIVVGNFQGHGEIPLHKDNDDYINAIVSIGGTNVEGGNTVYYTGTDMKNLGTKMYSIPFQHGRIQIGYFDEIIHGADKWSHGNRGVINFSMKKKLVSHFKIFGMKYYSQFIKHGYPSGEFIAS